MYDGPMETFEYIWVNIWSRLSGIIGFYHTVGHSGIELISEEYTKRDSVVAGRDKLSENLNALHG